MKDIYIEPLLFMPSPRDIPDVKKWWPKLPYDKFIVKYKTQKEAYAEVKEFFVKNRVYTHLVICADDLEIPPAKLEMLLEDASLGFETVCGWCNLAESNELVTDLYPLNTVDFSKDRPETGYGNFYMLNKKPELPKVNYLVVDHCGSACRVISRELFERIRFEGNGSGGWFDWGISKDLKKLGIPNYINLEVKLWHRREEQKPVIAKEGYSYLWKN